MAQRLTYHLVDFTIDVAGDIILDADGGDVFFKDAGTTFGSATNTSGNLIIKSGTTTALTFNGANVSLAGTLDVSADAQFDSGVNVNSDLHVDKAPSTGASGSTGKNAFMRLKSHTGTTNNNNTDCSLDFAVDNTIQWNFGMKGQGGFSALADLHIYDPVRNKVVINFDGTHGAVNMPTQPAFSIKPTNTSDNTNLAINTTHTLALGTEVFDIGGNYANDAFTAPITGKYQLNAQVRTNSLDIDTEYYELSIATSNRIYTSIITPSSFSSNLGYFTMNIHVLADMDASDTAILKLHIPNNGAAQADIEQDTYFSGFLVC